MATPDELRQEAISSELLRSYENGPRIWDAAIFQPDVHDLLERKLIEPCPDLPGAYQITQAGRDALEARHA